MHFSGKTNKHQPVINLIYILRILLCKVGKHITTVKNNSQNHIFTSICETWNYKCAQWIEVDIDN